MSKSKSYAPNSLSHNISPTRKRSGKSAMSSKPQASAQIATSSLKSSIRILERTLKLLKKLEAREKKAAIAQSAVHLLGKEKVVGSNPTGSSKRLRMED